MRNNALKALCSVPMPTVVGYAVFSFGKDPFTKLCHSIYSSQVVKLTRGSFLQVASVWLRPLGCMVLIHALASSGKTKEGPLKILRVFLLLFFGVFFFACAALHLLGVTCAFKMMPHWLPFKI